jgi:hypothetical protein
MDHQDFVLLVTLVMLLIEMLQEVFLGAVPTSSIIFQIDFTKDVVKGTFKSRYVILVFALEEHKIMFVMKTLSVNLGYWVCWALINLTQFWLNLNRLAKEVLGLILSLKE